MSLACPLSIQKSNTLLHKSSITSLVCVPYEYVLSVLIMYILKSQKEITGQGCLKILKIACLHSETAQVCNRCE